MLDLLSGCDCLEDMDGLPKDLLICEVNCPLLSSTSYGDFLQKFSGIQLQRFNQKLCRMAADLHLRGDDMDWHVLDMDSTSHEQHGVKMEAVAFNYKHEGGIYSIRVFDQKGFLYHLT